MDPPNLAYFDSVRDEQLQVFQAIRRPDASDLVRGQFRGYRDEPGVSPASDVETFAAVRLYIDSWRWEGVPFLIRAGKCLPVTATEALVKFRRPPIGRVRHADRNYIRFRLGPDLAIAIGARVKGSGETLTTTPAELLAVGQQAGDEISAYERLIADAMTGDPLLFARADGVETMWAIADPLVKRGYARLRVRARHVGAGAGRRHGGGHRRLGEPSRGGNALTHSPGVAPRCNSARVERATTLRR